VGIVSCLFGQGPLVSPMDDKTKPDETGYRFIGKPMPRKEDARLITGKGCFADEFSLSGEA